MHDIEGKTVLKIMESAKKLFPGKTVSVTKTYYDIPQVDGTSNFEIQYTISIKDHVTKTVCSFAHLIRVCKLIFETRQLELLEEKNNA